MTDVLTVPTHFGDLSELSEGLVDRVDEDRIILYGPAPFHEGSLVGFSVLLGDGTAALEGVGRVVQAVDGGMERAPETRYDIVFGDLQLQGRSEVVYERIVLARQSLIGDDVGTGEVSLDELESADSQPDPQPEQVVYDSQAPQPYDQAPYGQAYEDRAPAQGFDPGPAAYSEPPMEVSPSEVGEAFESTPAYGEGFQPSEDMRHGGHSQPPASGFPADEGTNPAFEEGAFVDPAMADTEGHPQVDVPFDVDPEEVSLAESLPPGSVPPDSLAPGSIAPEAESTDDISLDAIESDAFESVEANVDAFDERAAASEPPALPGAPQGFALQAPAEGQVLTRPAFPATWYPQAPPRPENTASGYFVYGPELPLPDAPPRPDIDASLRVSPAPRPGDPVAPPRFAPRIGEMSDPMSAEPVETEAVPEAHEAGTDASVDEGNLLNMAPEPIYGDDAVAAGVEDDALDDGHVVHEAVTGRPPAPDEASFEDIARELEHDDPQTAAAVAIPKSQFDDGTEAGLHEFEGSEFDTGYEGEDSTRAQVELPENDH